MHGPAEAEHRYTKIEDLSPLDDLPNLECLVDVHPKVSQEELDRFAEEHPNCIVSSEGHEYGYPWRYEQDGSPTPYYQTLKEVFHFRMPRTPCGKRPGKMRG